MLSFARLMHHSPVPLHKITQTELGITSFSPSNLLYTSKYQISTIKPHPTSFSTHFFLADHSASSSSTPTRENLGFQELGVSAHIEKTQ
ncbi:hypothetical protein L1887_38632 [Cichorium endivia]|nr:hypothetical protein L1887_38632 [Cichorium endivia]